ncbi:MAG: hypothetical protein AAB383_02980 [Patescibacteria group bacterium]
MKTHLTVPGHGEGDDLQQDFVHVGAGRNEQVLTLSEYAEVSSLAVHNAEQIFEMMPDADEETIGD